MRENFIIAEDINRDILCHFILFSLLIMSATKMRYTVIFIYTFMENVFNSYTMGKDGLSDIYT